MVGPPTPVPLLTPGYPPIFALMFIPLMGAVCGSVLNPPFVIGAFVFALVAALVVALVVGFGVVVEFADRPISEDTLGDPERSDLGVRQPVAARTRLNPQPAKTPIRRSIGKTPKSLDMKRSAREADGFRFQTNHRSSPRLIPITLAPRSLRYAIRPTGIRSGARPEREPPAISARAEYDGAESYRFRSIGQSQSPRSSPLPRIAVPLQDSTSHSAEYAEVLPGRLSNDRPAEIA